MKRIFLICCIFIFALSLVSVYARDRGGGSLIDEEDFEYENSPVNKLGRGLINTATCWTEIPGHIAEISKEKDPVVGTTMGLIQGTVLTLVRGVTGLFEVLTFVVPPYDKPIMEPEYAMEEADENLQEYLW